MKTPMIIVASVLGVLATAGAAMAVNAATLSAVNPGDIGNAPSVLVGTPTPGITDPATPTPTPTPSVSGGSDDGPGHDVGDDHGGLNSGSDDDSSGDDSGSDDSGSDDSGSDDSGSDDSGHSGSDDDD
ncbi:MAG: hypothetical protein ABI566_07380 [Pseudolysinimonas sp.]